MSARSKSVNLHPLRKILRRELFREPGYETSIPKDLLECGHVLNPAQDIIGTRWPERRRCYKCTNESPQDFEPPKGEDL